MARIRSTNNRRRRANERVVARQVANRIIDRKMEAAIRSAMDGRPVMIHGRPGLGLQERVRRIAQNRGHGMAVSPRAVRKAEQPVVVMTEGLSKASDPETMAALRKLIERTPDRMAG